MTEASFRKVAKTGVIYVMSRARTMGYTSDQPEWVNFGQGQPESGTLPGGPKRLETLELGEGCFEYAPVNGILELREAVASLYNKLYRRGLPSQYSAENVCITPGGRAGLTRAIGALGNINLGHFLPDYTAYEELLGLFRVFNPIPILLEPDSGYEFSIEQLQKEITGRGLGGLLLSNPCNPTGKTISGDELAGWVRTCRSLNCTLLLDEFYSHYFWKTSLDETPAKVSAAEFVTDVNSDPVVLFDGLTKNWRYPGWRVSWVVGPKKAIESISSTGSFLDGGANHPLQKAALDLVNSEYISSEANSFQPVFVRKRAKMIEKLTSLGFRNDLDASGTFYNWVRLDGLPESIDTGEKLFEKALQKRMIIVPGQFFDIDPGGKRAGRIGRFSQYARLSFGPEERVIDEGLDRLAELVKEAAAESP